MISSPQISDTNTGFVASNDESLLTDGLYSFPSVVVPNGYIYIIGGYYLTAAEVSKLAEILIDKGIPSLTTSTVDDVVNGLLATNHDKSEINQFFRRIALSVESYILDDDLHVIKRKTISKNLYVNSNLCDKKALLTT